MFAMGVVYTTLNTTEGIRNENHGQKSLHEKLFMIFSLALNGNKLLIFFSYGPERVWRGEVTQLRVQVLGVSF